MTVLLTTEDVQEVWHKMGVLADSPDLQADYKITQKGATAIVKSIPKQAGTWTLPRWGERAIKGEMLDHVAVLRDCANDAADAGNLKNASEIRRQARRLERLFGK